MRQPIRVGAIAYGPALDEQWGIADAQRGFLRRQGRRRSAARAARARFEPAAHPALHPGRAARVTLEGEPIGWLGELHPRWQQKYELPLAPVVFELDLEALRDTGLPRFAEVSKFPPVIRDLAM